MHPLSGLEITELELFKVPPRWLFLKLKTKSGISGWGEPVVEGRAETVAAAIREIRPHLIGHPANKIEDFWQMIYRGGFYRGGPVLMSALSGIDQALWDIKGKALGVPVYELLGGAVRDKMKIYGWIHGDTPEALAEAAKKRVAAGFTAVKMTVTDQLEWIDAPYQVNAAAERLAAVRNAIGDQYPIGVDLHGRVHKGMAKMIAQALEPFHPYFLEELVLSENNDSLSALHNFTAIPIATGERMYSRWDFKKILQDGTVDILQPDLSHAGGISEVKRIATMAEAYDVAIAPHCPLGPISLAAALQIDFSCINALIQETSLGVHYNEDIDLTDYLVDPEVFGLKDGYVPLLTAPGLGIEIDEDKVREAARTGHDWKNPIWRNPDGSVTEW
ncbi:galactonate dehydratase [Flavilitoribacter nigricans]|uniref:Galactonate dehydratase n=1 Tax=Flavilitoribacter nigricans (strain ATCC 23147 / DSM 23189 / NBRC 102662 / NCIMB 1420 / SS-2) TaxID=1122177 RepID=A0A2D0N2H2_FLAN2|nr:galactonate dehydratase [Flavilitoribacter nigricans]PHN02742.1 galactonate dehydratase [Flavilitoribacter nigricans DSM 23189 = NBRC 102662]